jgi:hypothetical protein
MILTLIKHIRNGSKIGNTGTILIQCSQMMAGTSKPILDDTQDIPYTESKWIRKLCKHLHQINAQIKEVEPWTIPTAPRKHNIHIMGAILSSPTIPPSKYAVLNYCRIDLQVTTLSEIVTSNRKFVRHDALLGDTDWSKFLDVMQWPNQPKPDPDSWKLWDKTIRKLFCNEGEQKLRQPLGKWTETEETK